jgi:hypothetical protein
MSIKALDLFDAYKKSQLPNENGYIVSSFFSDKSLYSRYEVISYSNVKSIYHSDEGLTFQSDGKKLHILIEPPTYPQKGEEPFVRSSHEKIPLRFSELELHTCKNETRVYYAKQAAMSYTSFTIMTPRGANFSFVFFDLPDVFTTMVSFFEKTFNKEAAVPLPDEQKVSKAIGKKLNEVLTWEYSTG